MMGRKLQRTATIFFQDSGIISGRGVEQQRALFLLPSNFEGVFLSPTGQELRSPQATNFNISEILVLELRIWNPRRSLLGSSSITLRPR